MKAFSYDIDIRVHDEARPDLVSLVHTVELATPAHNHRRRAAP